MTDIELIHEEHRRRADERAMLKAMAAENKPKPKLSPGMAREIARVNHLAESIKGTTYQEPKPEPKPMVIWPETVKVTHCPPAKGRFDEFRRVA